MKYLKRAVAFLLALILLFEEWGWVPMQRALSWIGGLPILRWGEAAIKRSSPFGAFIWLAVPVMHAFFLKLVGWALIADGHFIAGVLFLLVVKLISTAIVAYIFHLVRPTLLTLPWFARLYTRWVEWKTALFTWVRESWPWRYSRYVKRLVKRAVGLHKRQASV